MSGTPVYRCDCRGHIHPTSCPYPLGIESEARPAWWRSHDGNWHPVHYAHTEMHKHLPLSATTLCDRCYRDCYNNGEGWRDER
jgi:uncharacterized cysteine cluster protein YcgN (CxxCxxCC family)